MKRVVRALACGAALLIASSPLVACGSSAEAGKPGSGDGVLTVAMVSAPQSFDPVATNTPQAPYLRPIFDSLVRKVGLNEYKPGLATDWTFDGRTLTMTLRKGVTFTDDVPFDAEAAVANLERGMKTPGPQQRTFSSFKDVEATGPHAIAIHLRKPLPNIIDALSGIAGMMVSPKSFDSKSIDRKPVGTGPWMLSLDRSVDGSSYHYVKNPDYWAPQLQGFDKLVIRVLSNPSASRSALITGQVDVAQVNSTQIAAAKKAGLKIESAPIQQWAMFVLDRKGIVTPALADQRVRQAMAYAINREALVKSVLHGHGDPGGSFFAPDHLGYAESTENSYPYNPAKAKQLLAEAGYAKGFSFPLPTIPAFESMAQAVAGQLAKVGINIKLVSKQPGGLGAALASKKYPIGLYFTVQDQPFDMVMGSYGQGAGNPFGDTPQRISQLINSMEGVSNETKIEKTYVQMMEYLNQQAYLIPLARQSLTFAVSSNLEGVQVTGGLLPNPRGITPKKD